MDKRNIYDKKEEDQEEKKPLKEYKIIIEQPTPPDIEEEERKKRSSINLSSVLKRYYFYDGVLAILSMAFFTVSLFMQLHVEFRFKTRNTIKRFLGYNTISFEKRETLNLSYFEDYYNGLSDTFSKTVNESESYYGKFQLVSEIRATQRRIKLTDDYYPKTPILTSKVYRHLMWDTGSLFGIKGEDQYNSKRECNYKDNKDYTYKGFGGLVYNASNNNFNEWINDEEGNCPNTNLTALTFDFVVADFESGLFCCVIETNDINLFNISDKKADILCSNLDVYKSEWNFFRAGCEICFVAFNFVYFCSFMIKIIFMNKHKFDDENVGLSKIVSKNKYNRKRSCNNKCSKFLELFDYSDIVQFICFIFELICIILWICYMVYHTSVKQNMEDIFKHPGTKLSDVHSSDNGYNLQNKLLTCCTFFELYRLLACVSLLLMYYRLIPILSKFINSAEIFLTTIRESLPDFVSLFIFLVIFLCGFSFFGWIYYGRNLEEFRILSSSFNQTFSFFVGVISNDIFVQMFNDSKVMTVFYFIVLMFVIRFTSFRLNLGIMLYYFKKANESDMLKRKNLTEKLEILPNLFTTIVLIYSKIINFFLNFIFCCCYVNTKNRHFSLIIPTKSIDLLQTDYQKKIGLIDVPEIKQRSDKINDDITDLQKAQNEFEIYENNEDSSLIPDKDKSKIGGGIDKQNEDENNLPFEQKELQDKINIKKAKQDKSKEEKKQNYEKCKNKVYKNEYNIIRVNRNKIDTDYSEDYEFSLRNPYFDSQIDGEKIKEFYEDKYRNQIFNGFINLCFTIVIIVNMMFNVLSAWKYDINTSIASYFPNFFNITTYQDIRDFYFGEVLQKFSQSSSSSHKYSNFTLLNNENLGNKVYITIRKGKRDQSSLSKNRKLRRREQYGLNDISFEDDTPLSLPNNSVWENETKYWNTDNTYNFYGGFSLEININQRDNESYIKESQQILFNDSADGKETYISYLDFITMELFLINDYYQSCVYISFTTKTDFGCFFNNTLETRIFSFNHKFEQHINKAINPTDIIVLLFLAYFISQFIYDAVQSSKIYDKWCEDVTYGFGLRNKDYRNIIMPELLRKFFFIFNFRSFLDFVYILLSIALIVCKVIFTQYQNKFISDVIDKKKFDISTKDLRDIFYNAITFRYDYEMVGIIIIIIGIIKFITVININKYFTILIETFLYGIGSILTQIFILICIQPCFAFLSFIAFGVSDMNYYRLDNAILKTFQLLFGYIDVFEIKDANIYYGTIILYLYFIIINFIFMNIFIANLYTLYSHVVVIVSNRKEEYSWKNIFSDLFCGIFCGCCKETKFCYFCYNCCCCQQKKKQKKKKNEFIYLELDYDKQLKKYPSKLIIYKEKCSKSDFFKNEKEQIKLLDNDLYNLSKSIKDSDLCYSNNKLSNNYFDKNIYKNIQANEKRSLDVKNLNYQLIVIEQLENDLLCIDEGIEQLDKVKDVNFEDKKHKIQNQINLVNTTIKEVETSFADLYNAININQVQYTNITSTEN